MLWVRASAKLKIPPWVKAKMTPFKYFAREMPAVFYSTLAGVAVMIPMIPYYIKKANEEPLDMVHQKINYTIARPRDYPAELHKHCRIG